MTKKVSKKTIKPKSEPTPPTISFTEEEVKNVADFASYVHDRAIFDKMTAPEAKKLWTMLSFMGAHCKKMESYIFEFKQAIKPE